MSDRTPHAHVVERRLLGVEDEHLRMKLRGENDARTPLGIGRQARHAFGRSFAQEGQFAAAQLIKQFFAALVKFDRRAVRVRLFSIQ